MSVSAFGIEHGISKKMTKDERQGAISGGAGAGASMAAFPMARAVHRKIKSIGPEYQGLSRARKLALHGMGHGAFTVPAALAGGAAAGGITALATKDRKKKRS